MSAKGAQAGEPEDNSFKGLCTVKPGVAVACDSYASPGAPDRNERGGNRDSKLSARAAAGTVGLSTTLSKG